MMEKNLTKALIQIIQILMEMAPQTEKTTSRLTQMRIPIPMETGLETMQIQTMTAMVFLTQMKLPMALIH